MGKKIKKTTYKIALKNGDSLELSCFDLPDCNDDFVNLGIVSEGEPHWRATLTKDGAKELKKALKKLLK